MNEDSKTSLRNRAIKEYENHVKNSKYETDNEVYSMTVMASAGYFLKVHSKNPSKALSKYHMEHDVSYKKSKEIKMLLSILM